MKFRKTMATLLSVVMLFTLFTPFTVSAEATPVISVESVTDIAGATVNVDVTIENNPGILGATLTLTYDDGLTLINATEGEAFSALMMTKPGAFTSPCNFLWDGQEINAGNIKDGTILSLKFKISENANAGDEYAVNLSYASGDIFDANVQPIDIAINSGSISIVDYLPGDLNGDRTVNSGDIILLRRHVAGGYQQTINESAGDVNSDGKQNSGDIILIRRYVAGGYPDVILKPSKPLCNHIMNEVPYNAPTCLENGNIAYWSCSRCNKLYSDKNGITAIKQEDTVINASGHTIVIDPAIKPTYDSTGLTEGRHCSVCSTVTVEQIVLPPLEKENYSITYYIDNNDEYLKSIVVDNPNPYSYSKEDGLVLQDLIVDGYNFVGWYTAQTGGERVTEIKAGETGNKTLYAHWEKVTYTISFASDMVPVNSIPYSVGEEKPLPKPTLDKYTFVGWSDKYGKIWDIIPAGTTGNLILYANWSSDRNKAIPVEHLSEPAIMTDSQNGLIYFSYKIGKIVNVPLYQMSEILTANGVETEITTTKSTSQKVQTSQEIAKTLSEATTNSTSWALSNDWNNVTEVSEKYIEENRLERETAEILAKNSAGSYTVGYQSGGTSGTINVSDSSYAISNNNNQHREFEHQNEESVVTTVDHKFNAEINASFPISVLNVNAKAGYNYENNKVTSTSTSDKYAGTNDWSKSENYSGSKSNTSSNSKSWNSTSNSTSSWSETKTDSVKNAISEMVTREYNTNNKYELGGSESNTIGKSTVTGEENKLSSTVLYDTTNITTEAVTYKTTGNTHGGYRIVLAGTLQVYAVVVYDIATSEYSVQTYSVLGDGSDNDAPKPYLDYSWAGNQFDDYHNSVLPFDIPYEVNGYVNSLVAKTDGLKFNPDKGQVTQFNNELGSELVYVPTYISVDNGDNTYSFTQIKSLSKDLFKNNTDIKAVRLGNGITEIPEGTFEGCINLTDVYAPNVTKIDSRAFAGCENLNNFTISEDITYIGSNAFEGVSNIDAVASSVEVATAVAQSGAKNIVLNISKIPDDKKNNIEFNINDIEKFELRGGGREYPGLSITSDAKTMVLNRITFTQNTKTPMTLSSKNVTLDQVTVECTGYALVLKAPNTKLTLNRTTNNLLSSTGVAAICKNIDIAEMDGSSFECGMQVNGNILVCDSYSGDDLIEFNGGEFKVITEDEYENYLTLRKVTFDANDGSLNEETKMIAMNSVVGELPVPTRDYYTFDGWYTKQDGGEEITSESVITSDITLYAHWVQNDVSAWTLATEVPEDAEVVDRKWTYTLTSYAESHSSSMSGWTKYDETWEWSSYGSWSSWQDSHVAGSDSREVRTQSVVSYYNKKTQWHYHRYRNSSGTRGWPIQGTDTPNLQNSGWLDYQLEYQGVGSSSGYKQYGKGAIDGCPIYWYNEQSRQVDNYNSPVYKTQYSYRDRSKIYTYYFTKDESKESTTYPTGNDISNIQEYVQYRTK